MRGFRLGISGVGIIVDYGFAGFGLGFIGIELRFVLIVRFGRAEMPIFIIHS